MPDIPESHRALLDAPVAVLGTIDDDGFPQLTSIWFAYVDGTFHVSINDSRAKARFLEARPQCSLLIPDPANPYRYLEVRGTAVIGEDTNGAVGKLVHDKYDADVSQYDRPGDKRLAVTIEPRKIYAVDMSS
jgi:PPOX class probable F420-dependent enzyme